MNIKEWLKQAESDYDAAIYNIEGGKMKQGVFFLQQAAEKALKAIYIKKFKKLIKTHDLIFLSKKLKIPNKIKNYCIELNPAYQYTRYPDMPKIENLEKISKNLIFYTGEIIKWTKKNI